MKVKDNLAKILIPILSILIAFIAGGIIILCLGEKIRWKLMDTCFPEHLEADVRWGRL